MSLSYDFTRCDDAKPAEEVREMWGKCVSFLAMFTGLDTLTERNFEEAFRRFELWETIGGAIAGDIHGPITRSTLHAFIGARWNVSRMTKREFTARCKSYALTHAEEQARRNARKAS